MYNTKDSVEFTIKYIILVYTLCIRDRISIASPCLPSYAYTLCIRDRIFFAAFLFFSMRYTLRIRDRIAQELRYPNEYLYTLCIRDRIFLMLSTSCIYGIPYVLGIEYENLCLLRSSHRIPYVLGIEYVG